MKKELIKLANHLDRIGRVKEADFVDNLLKRAQGRITLIPFGKEEDGENTKFVLKNEEGLNSEALLQEGYRRLDSDLGKIYLDYEDMNYENIYLYFLVEGKEIVGIYTEEHKAEDASAESFSASIEDWRNNVALVEEYKIPTSNLETEISLDGEYHFIDL